MLCVGLVLPCSIAGLFDAFDSNFFGVATMKFNLPQLHIRARYAKPETELFYRDFGNESR